MFCKECQNQIPDKAGICIKCGVPTGNQPTAGITGGGSKSRTTYVLLGVLLGLIGLPGIRNFYAGYSTKAIIQLYLTIFTCWILWIPMLIWKIIKTCTVTVDNQGNPMI